MHSNAVLFGITLLPFLLFCSFYCFGSPGWWRTWVGRGLMALSGSLVAVLGYAVLVQFIDIPEEWKDLLRTLMLGAVSLAGWLQFINLLGSQRRDRDRRCEEEKEIAL